MRILPKAKIIMLGMNLIFWPPSCPGMGNEVNSSVSLFLTFAHFLVIPDTKMPHQRNLSLLSIAFRVIDVEIFASDGYSARDLLAHTHSAAVALRK
jgi:hypothetical protein